MKRILIIRFSSLGDLILTTPVLDNLKAALPQVELGLATKSAFADLFRYDPRLAHLFLLKADKGLWQLGREIRAWQPDLVIDLHANLRSRWLSLLLGRPLRQALFLSINGIAAAMQSTG